MNQLRRENIGKYISLPSSSAIPGPVVKMLRSISGMAWAKAILEVPASRNTALPGSMSFKAFRAISRFSFQLVCILVSSLISVGLRGQRLYLRQGRRDAGKKSDDEKSRKKSHPHGQFQAFFPNIFSDVFSAKLVHVSSFWIWGILCCVFPKSGGVGASWNRAAPYFWMQEPPIWLWPRQSPTWISIFPVGWPR